MLACLFIVATSFGIISLTNEYKKMYLKKKQTKQQLLRINTFLGGGLYKLQCNVGVMHSEALH